MTEAPDIVFDAPRILSGPALERKPFEAADLGRRGRRQRHRHGRRAAAAERHDAALSRAREADAVAFGDPQRLKMMIGWQA